MPRCSTCRRRGTNSLATPLFYFLVALLTAFVATLPFGPINLTVVKTTVDHHRAAALKVSFGASLVETVQAWIAIYFGLFISRFLADHASVNLLIAAAFIGLAIYVYIHDSHPSLANNNVANPSFIKRGLFVATINPQAIPFWVFAVATISQNLGFDYVGGYLVLFLLGVFLGKMLALYGFVIASDYLKSHLDESSRAVNHLLAAVLFIIGLIQIWRFLNA